MSRPRRSRRRSGARFSAHQATHSLGLHLVMVVVLLATLTLLSGCTIENDTENDAAVAPEPEVEESYEPRQAATPLSDYGEYDPDEIEQGRFDSAWRDAATTDREYRSSTTGRASRHGTDGATPRTADRRPTASGNPILVRLQEEGDGSGEAVQPEMEPEGEGPDAASQGTASGQSGASDQAASGPPETWDAIAPDAFDGEPRFPVDTEGGGPTVLRIQYLLDRAHFSPGVIDGRWGKNTEKAVYWLQDSLGMEPTGQMDRALYDRLHGAVGEDSPVREHTLTAADLEGPFVEIPEETAPKAELDCLCYESVEEKLAETFHSTVDLLEQLNPDADLANLSEGDSLWVPAVEVREPGGAGKAGDDAGEVDRIVISRSGFYLHALDADGEVLYHFPSTLGSEYDPSPEGEWRVEGVAWKPDFHYQPKLFSDVPDSEEDVMLPPGPNSPVGQVWMSLSKENYGIHGTAEPSTIGYTSSHGCIRLTNWDAIFLGHRVKPGVAVEFRE